MCKLQHPQENIEWSLLVKGNPEITPRKEGIGRDEDLEEEEEEEEE